MIENVLVANRGEIACRVVRTCRALGIATVAVHSDADAGALHVRAADTAVRLPGTASADTYLRADLLVRAAVAAGADAVHPGYGFLSESAAFARAVRAAGLVWIGPPPEAMEAMASKTRAKEIAAGAGIPVLTPLVPDAVRPADLPVLVKAAAGGGGRGMRVVRERAELDAALASARAEAAAAFGDGTVFVEPYVTGGRHVEVQVLADAHGTVWTLGTRDCSLQRRHQKIVEEAPAPGLPAGLEDALCAHAAALARVVGYEGAGTVEFLVGGDGRPWFLEMNTRLQVEHPVTECVYGVDLVALQLRVAEGGRLEGEPPVRRGHAVEARLYAEDPGREWRPWVGVVREVAFGGVPAGGSGGGTGSAGALGGPYVTTGAEGGLGSGGAGGASGLRVDLGVGPGDDVSPYYDGLLAKAVAHAADRPAALRLLARSLERARIHGPVTNRDLLVRTLRHPEFAAGGAGTDFYDRRLAELTASGGALYEADARRAALAAALADAWGRSPFGGWRNVPSGPQVKRFRVEPEGTEYEVRYRVGRDGGLVEPSGPEATRLCAVELLRGAGGGRGARVVLETPDGVRRPYAVAFHEDSAYVDGPSGAWTFTVLPRFPDPAPAVEPGSLHAPMPGTVVRVADGVAPGREVAAGQPLLWLEAMKMEHRVTAPADGTLTALHASPGRQVSTGDLLAVVTPTRRPPTPPDVGVSAPDGRVSVPTDDGAAPAGDASEPDSRVSAPTSDGSTQGSYASAPDEYLVGPDGPTNAPDTPMSVPDKVPPVPDRSPPAPDKHAAAPSEPTFVPDKPPAAQGESPAAQDERTSASGEPTPVPDKRTALPDKAPPVPDKFMPVPDKVPPVPDKLTPVPDKAQAAPDGSPPVPDNPAPVPDEIPPAPPTPAPPPALPEEAQP
ncbi:ATP-grasp domain-containing protein [Streptomyces sp. TYQ1024]|nr:ATP-grasp domain-containing protein [Streptomyces sp. TYQ1024]